jgi:hypothetical protein
VIDACIVNHNTSSFAELALRSLMATNDVKDLRVTVIDNESTDEGLAALVSAAEALGARFSMSSWPSASTTVNSHGEVLRDFVLAASDDTEGFLFVDADIVFTEPGVVEVLRSELAADSVWAVQTRYQWSEDAFGPGGSLDVAAGVPVRVSTLIETDSTSFGSNFAGQFSRRVHPGCTLIRNSPTFRSVAEHVRFSASVIISSDPTWAGPHDTMALASHTMQTHGLQYVLSRATVLHYFGVSYPSAEGKDRKTRDCAELLAVLRHMEPTPNWYQQARSAAQT